MASSQWLGAEEYEKDHPLHKRAEAFLQQVDWDVLIQICSEAHRHVGCRLHEKFSLGHSNLVRQVIFEDGEEWVARLRLPDIPSIFGQRELLDVQSIMKSEIAATKYLRQNTKVPVPNIYLYDLDPKNKVGAPFMLMEYINGTTAMDLNMRKNCAPFTFGTEEQDARLRQQMARIQAELARCRFDGIGSLQFDEENKRFFIGPDIVTGLGPWKTSFAYYNDAAEQALKNSVSEQELSSRTSFAVPVLFKDLVVRFCTDEIGPFSLTNRDLGFHNVLVDENFALIGMIDLDGIMAAPKEVVGQFPVLSGMDPPAPGITTSNPLALKRQEREKHWMESYATLLREHADGPGGQIFADIMTTQHALIRGLRAFEMQQDFVNDRWMESLLYLLRGKVSKK